MNENQSITEFVENQKIDSKLRYCVSTCNARTAGMSKNFSEKSSNTDVLNGGSMLYVHIASLGKCKFSTKNKKIRKISK